MVQVKIYGLRAYLEPIKVQLSDLIHSCIVDALQFPQDKRAHRFFLLDASDFFYPTSRTQRYAILELSMIEGRSVETQKQLIRLLFDRVSALDISPQDLKITIFETPRHHWVFRGLPGDEHPLNYKIEV